MMFQDNLTKRKHMTRFRRWYKKDQQREHLQAEDKAIWRTFAGPHFVQVNAAPLLPKGKFHGIKPSVQKWMAKHTPSARWAEACTGLFTDQYYSFQGFTFETQDELNTFVAKYPEAVRVYGSVKP
jgi:hypothetical protein